MSWNFAGASRNSLISCSSSTASSSPATSANVTFGWSFDSGLARDLPKLMTRPPPWTWFRTNRTTPRTSTNGSRLSSRLDPARLCPAGRRPRTRRRRRRRSAAVSSSVYPLGEADLVLGAVVRARPWITWSLVEQRRRRRRRRRRGGCSNASRRESVRAGAAVEHRDDARALRRRRPRRTMTRLRRRLVTSRSETSGRRRVRPSAGAPVGSDRLGAGVLDDVGEVAVPLADVEAVADDERRAGC